MVTSHPIDGRSSWVGTWAIPSILNAQPVAIGLVAENRNVPVTVLPLPGSFVPKVEEFHKID